MILPILHFGSVCLDHSGPRELTAVTFVQLFVCDFVSQLQNYKQLEPPYVYWIRKRDRGVQCHSKSLCRSGSTSGHSLHLVTRVWRRVSQTQPIFRYVYSSQLCRQYLGYTNNLVRHPNARAFFCSFSSPTRIIGVLTTISPGHRLWQISSGVVGQ